MRRRQYLGAAAITTTVALSACTELDDVSILLDSDIESLEWEDGTLVIDVAPDTSADEWGIKHEYHDDPSDLIFSGQLDEFGGTVEIPRHAFDAEQYPTDRFRFVLYALTTDAFELEYERVTSVAFELPER